MPRKATDVLSKAMKCHPCILKCGAILTKCQQLIMKKMKAKGIDTKFRKDLEFDIKFEIPDAMQSSVC